VPKLNLTQEIKALDYETTLKDSNSEDDVTIKSVLTMSLRNEGQQLTNHQTGKIDTDARYNQAKLLEKIMKLNGDVEIDLTHEQLKLCENAILNNPMIEGFVAAQAVDMIRG